MGVVAVSLWKDEDMGLENKVWFLERGLFELFPERYKEEWDNVGLIVGNKEMEVTNIAVSLDPSVQAIDKAVELGCNVLLTHHPVFLQPPRIFVENAIQPRSSIHAWSSQAASDVPIEHVVGGAIATEAIRNDVALIAMHTNFDYSDRNRHVLPDALGFTYLNPIEQTAENGAVGPGASHCGIGQLCSTPATTLYEIVDRCKQVFKVTPRIWGDPNQIVEFVGTCPGSASSLVDSAVRIGVDCFICGEIRYHSARAAMLSGMSVVELGHDVSENLFVDELRLAVVDLGYSPSRVIKLEEPPNWWTI
jgi:putative NIF3 family GTP cyclohydrolase 1 type 2